MIDDEEGVFGTCSSLSIRKLCHFWHSIITILASAHFTNDNHKYIHIDGSEVFS